MKGKSDAIRIINAIARLKEHLNTESIPKTINYDEIWFEELTEIKPLIKKAHKPLLNGPERNRWGQKK